MIRRDLAAIIAIALPSTRANWRGIADLRHAHVVAPLILIVYLSLKS